MEKYRLIITIDGPAGAGKSTVARKLAKRLGFQFLNTGAMYRAIALAAIQAGVDWSNATQLARTAEAVKLRIEGDQVFLNDVDVSEEIRTAEVTEKTRFIADHPQIRGELVALQRSIAEQENYVTDGRDQGTVAFPDAAWKFFLTASPEERARRRQRDLKAKGQHATEEELLKQQTLRDEQDTNREVGALRKAEDAIEVCSDHLTLMEVVDKLERIVRKKETPE